MNGLVLRVPVSLVKRVNDALVREGLEVLETTLPAIVKGGKFKEAETILTVIEGEPPAGVPRVIAHDGPPLPSPAGMKLRGWA